MRNSGHVTARFASVQTDPRFMICALTTMALIVYVLGFRAASFSWFNAIGAATAHVLPGAAVGTAAWYAQRRLDRLQAPRWLVHPLLAVATAACWLALMLAFTYLARPEIVGHVARAASPSTLVSGIVLYAAVAMMRAVFVSGQRAAESEAARARAELAALRARVEPHFLYNTLETIAGLVRQDADLAEKAIGRLGRLLRRVLEAQPGDDVDALVPVSEEMTIVRDYLAIERLRFGERLRIVERVDREVPELGIPSLTLQTLVENAVTHGLAGQRGAGTISVSAAREGPRLVMIVADDGAGAEEDCLLEGGVGLKLLRQRLESRFRPQFRFDVAARPGHGVSIRIEIPAVEIG